MGSDVASDLQVSLSQSGGITGIRRTFTLDAAELPAAEADRLRQLVAAIDVDAVDTPSKPSHPDAFQYAVTIRQGASERTMRVGEGSPFQPLIDFLRDHQRAADLKKHH